MNAQRKITPRRLLYPLLVLVVIALAAGTLTAIHFFQSQAPQTQNMYTKGQARTLKTPSSPSGSNNSGPADNQSSSQNPHVNNPGTNIPTTLVAPSGDFVSAHNVAVTTLINSVCAASPGVDCTVIFTNVSTSDSHSLATELTDAGGAAYWNGWSPQSIGLVPGTWKIKAIASSGGQTESTTDAMNLVVSP